MIMMTMATSNHTKTMTIATYITTATYAKDSTTVHTYACIHSYINFISILI